MEEAPDKLVLIKQNSNDFWPTSPGGDKKVIKLYICLLYNSLESQFSRGNKCYFYRQTQSRH